MAEDTWEQFANQGAERYIATYIDSSTPEGRTAFFRSGQEYVDSVVADLGDLLCHRDAVLDFGCGVGRLTIPLARQFRQAAGVDISPTMLKKLAVNCEEVGVDNVTPYLTDEEWESAGPFDLVNSCWVFQHLPSDAEVETCLRRVAACLADTGLAVLQFDSRRKTAAYRFRDILPDVALPQRWRSGIRRYRRSPPQLHALFRRAGLQPIEEHGVGTAMHVIRGRKT